MNLSEHIAGLLAAHAPEDIECRSFAVIDAEVPEPRPFSGPEWAIARRLVHTTADFDLLNHLKFSPGAVRAGLTALRQGAANARNPEGSVAEIRRYLEAGIDAFFTDDPALGRRAVDGDAVAGPGPHAGADAGH